jgi:type II secretory ATPase GspE/PulE/Tfp pilus assembly ATPase PilB-like protein
MLTYTIMTWKKNNRGRESSEDQGSETPSVQGAAQVQHGVMLVEGGVASGKTRLVLSYGLAHAANFKAANYRHDGHEQVGK